MKAGAIRTSMCGQTAFGMSFVESSSETNCKGCMRIITNGKGRGIKKRYGSQIVMALALKRGAKNIFKCGCGKLYTDSKDTRSGDHYIRECRTCRSK